MNRHIGIGVGNPAIAGATAMTREADQTHAGRRSTGAAPVATFSNKTNAIESCIGATITNPADSVLNRA